MTKKLQKKIKAFIESNPKIRGGQYVFKGSRISVDYVVDYINKGWTIRDIEELFPELDKNLIFKISNTITDSDSNGKREEIKISWLPYA